MLETSLDGDQFIDETQDIYEPVNVKPRFKNPKAEIDPDKSKNWFRRVLPILLANKWSFSMGITLMITTMMLGVSVPALIGKLVDLIEPSLTTGENSNFLFLLLD